MKKTGLFLLCSSLLCSSLMAGENYFENTGNQGSVGQHSCNNTEMKLAVAKLIVKVEQLEKANSKLENEVLLLKKEVSINNELTKKLLASSSAPKKEITKNGKYIKLTGHVLNRMCPFLFIYIDNHIIYLYYEK